MSSYVLPVNEPTTCNGTSLTASDILYTRRQGNLGLYGQKLNELIGVQVRDPPTLNTAITGPIFLSSSTAYTDTEMFIQQKLLWFGNGTSTPPVGVQKPFKLFRTKLQLNFYAAQALSSAFTFTFDIQITDPSTCDLPTTVYNNDKNAIKAFYLKINAPTESVTDPANLSGPIYWAALGTGSAFTIDNTKTSVIPVYPNLDLGIGTLPYSDHWLRVTATATPASGTINAGTKIVSNWIIYTLLPDEPVELTTA